VSEITHRASNIFITAPVTAGANATDKNEEETNPAFRTYISKKRKLADLYDEDSPPMSLFLPQLSHPGSKRRKI